MEISRLLLLSIDALKPLEGAIPPHSVYWLHPWRCCFLKLRDGGTSVHADFLPGPSFISVVTTTFLTVFISFCFQQELKSCYLISEGGTNCFVYLSVPPSEKHTCEMKIKKKDKVFLKSCTVGLMAGHS